MSNDRVESKILVWWLVTGLSLLTLFVVAVSCGAAEQQNSKEPAGEEQAAANLEHPSLGDDDAPVVMTEYADYQ